MRRDLDDLIAKARESVSPSAEATERARAAVRAATPAPGRRRLPLPRRNRLWILGTAALVLGAGAATAAVVGTRGGGHPFVPAIENCYSLQGWTLRIPRLHTEVRMHDASVATIAWVDITGVIRAADRSPGGDWADPVEIASLGTTAPANVGFSANTRGDAAIAWLQEGRTMAALRPAGGSWGDPVDLTRAGQYAAFAGGDPPSVLVSQDGGVVTSWISVAESSVRNGGTAIVGESGHAEVAVRPAGGDWATSPLEGTALSPATFAERGPGRITAGYLKDSGTIRVVDLDAATGAPLSTRNLRPPPTTVEPRSAGVGNVIVAGNGRGTVVATIMINGRIALWRSGAGGWSAGRLISPAGVQAGYHAVAVAPDGRVLTAWTVVTKERRPDGTTRRARSVYAALSGGEADVAATRVSRPGRLASGASVAFDARGGVVAWADGTNGISGSDSRVEAAWVAAGGRGFAKATALSTAGKGPLFPDVAMSAGGETVATWTRCTAKDEAEVQSAAAPTPGAEWSKPARVGP